MRITYSVSDLGFDFINDDNLFQSKVFLCNLKPGMVINKRSVLLFLEKDRKIYKFFSPVSGVVENVYAKSTDFINLACYKQPLITIKTLDSLSDCNDKFYSKGKKRCNDYYKNCKQSYSKDNNCDKGFCDEYFSNNKLNCYQKCDTCQDCIDSIKSSYSRLSECCADLKDFCSKLWEICDKCDKDYCCLQQNCLCC